MLIEARHRAVGKIGRGWSMNRSGEAKNAIITASGGARPPEQTAPIREHRTEERSEAYQTEPATLPCVPELSSSPINTDVRRRGIESFSHRRHGRYHRFYRRLSARICLLGGILLALHRWIASLWGSPGLYDSRPPKTGFRRRGGRK